MFDFSAFNFSYRPPVDPTTGSIHRATNVSIELVRIEVAGDEPVWWRLLMDKSGKLKLETNTPNPSDYSFYLKEAFPGGLPTLDDLIRFLDDLVAPSSEDDEVPDFSMDLILHTEVAIEKTLQTTTYISMYYPQLPVFMRARADHYLRHGQVITMADIPLDLARSFSGFDFSFRPETYWDDHATPNKDQDAQPEEVELGTVTFYSWLGSDSVIITAYRDPDCYEYGDNTDDDEEIGALGICYRSISRGLNWYNELSHNSNSPLAFWEFIDMLDGFGIEQDLLYSEEEDDDDEEKLPSYFYSDVYLQLEPFLNRRARILREHDRWVSIEEILTALEQETLMSSDLR